MANGGFATQLAYYPAADISAGECVPCLVGTPSHPWVALRGAHCTVHLHHPPYLNPLVRSTATHVMLKPPLKGSPWHGGTLYSPHDGSHSKPLMSRSSFCHRAVGNGGDTLIYQQMDGSMFQAQVGSLLCMLCVAHMDAGMRCTAVEGRMGHYLQEAMSKGWVRP